MTRRVESLLHQIDRNDHAHHLHVQALQAELRRLDALTVTGVRALESETGVPLQALIAAVADLALAGAVVRGAPIEDTARVAHADSTRLEGADTEWVRRYTGHVARQVAGLADGIGRRLAPGGGGAGRRCHRRECGGYGRRQHTARCVVCGGALS